MDREQAEQWIAQQVESLALKRTTNKAAWDTAQEQVDRIVRDFAARDDVAEVSPRGPEFFARREATRLVERALLGR